MRVQSIALVGESDPATYPLQKKGHTLEFLREIVHLRARSNTLGAVFRVRSAVSLAIHRFFHDRGFVYMHTPIITTSDCEGAGEMFKVTTLDLAGIKTFDGRVDYQEDFFKEPAFLTVSGQLEAEGGALALRNVYTFGPTFRAENSNTTRHLAEFWMIEPEMAFYDLQDNQALAEEFIQYLVRAALEECAADLEFLHQREWSDPGMIDTLASLACTKFEVLDYSEAIAALEKSGKAFEFPVKWGIDLQTEHERYLTDEYVKGPLFVVNYPSSIKAFYMRLNHDERTVAAMDVLVPRLGEIIGGSQREERYDVLTRRMQECGLDLTRYGWYLDLRRYGTVPHAGFGLGLERLLMYVTGMQNIRDVIPFPRYPGHAK
jgi:asparaginyl-tRNA synthetase